MAYKRESLQEINHRIAKGLGTTDLPYSFKGVLGKAVAGLSHMLHGHIDYCAQNMLPDSAETEYLERWARIWGIERKPATPAIATVEVKGQEGARIPQSWLIGGNKFALSNTLHLESESKQVLLHAERPGKLGSTADAANIGTTQGDIDATASVLSYTDGANAESDASLRERLLRLIPKAPQGGSYLDYIDWLESIPGVHRAWVKPAYLLGKPGHVELCFTGEGDTDALIKAGEQLLSTVAPAAACWRIQVPTPKPVTIEFEITPNTQKLRAAVHKKIRKVFQNEAEPAGYLNAYGQKTTGTIYLSRISAAISSIEGEERHRILSPTSDITVNDREIAVYAA